MIWTSGRTPPWSFGPRGREKDCRGFAGPRAHPAWKAEMFRCKAGAAWQGDRPDGGDSHPHRPRSSGPGIGWPIRKVPMAMRGSSGKRGPRPDRRIAAAGQLSLARSCNGSQGVISRHIENAPRFRRGVPTSSIVPNRITPIAESRGNAETRIVPCFCRPTRCLLREFWDFRPRPRACGHAVQVPCGPRPQAEGGT